MSTVKAEGRPHRPRVLLVGVGILLAILAVVVVFPGSPVRDALTVTLKHRECFISHGESDKKNATVALGDSITAGLTRPKLHVAADNSYFDIVGCESNSPITYVKNAGVWQNTTTMMLARLDSDVLALHPAQVLVVAGTNDINLGQSDRTIPNLTTIHDRLTAAGIRSVFAELPPNDLHPDETIAMNAAIREWASDAKVPLMDFWTPLASPTGDYREGMTVDGLHPSAAGAHVLAKVASQAIE